MKRCRPGMKIISPESWRPLAACAVACQLSLSAFAQSPVVVQPGAPGQPTKTLPSSTRPTLQAPSATDVQFMQHMITHHAQAVEMTALIESHTENQEIRTLGARIRSSQSDEIQFMRRWLEMRARPAQEAGSRRQEQELHTHGAHSSSEKNLMPGMLTPEQMNALKKAKGKEFDRLFLSGMIQHHHGALVMVKELFDAAGAGQDAELFNFASDVDSGQRAEIRRMEKLLAE